MPTMPGMTVYPWRSSTVVSSAGTTSAPFWIAEILPPSITIFRSSSTEAPVPSMMRAWLRTVFDARTRHELLDRFREMWDLGVYGCREKQQGNDSQANG